MNTFCRFDLRTTDTAGARTFYATVLGHGRSVIWPLHEQAIARGAPAHWLGTLGVEDAERTVAAFVERGATRLGPTPKAKETGPGIVLRDPGGAVLAVASRLAGDTHTGVAFHVLHTNDVAQAMRNYVEQLAWEPTNSVDLGAQGAFQRFAWRTGGESVGAMGDIAGRPGLHAHWSFFFEVASLDASVAAVRGAGGSLTEATTLPSGQRVCVCHDPQGAEFALWEGRRPGRAD